MSNYPSPYSPQPQYPTGYGHAPPGIDLIAPARRASILLIVIGALTLAFSLCAGATVLAYSRQQLQAAIDANPFLKNPQELPPGVALVDVMRSFYQSASLIGVISGPILILLGIAIRRANKTAVVFAVIFCGLLVLFDVLSILFGYLFGFPMLIAGACLGFLPTALLVLAIVWLMQTLRALPQIEAMRLQSQAYYAAAQQQQQIYQQGPAGYGYGVAPPVNYGQPPQAGAPPGQTPYGYGASPLSGAPPVDQGAPPTRHPPLPPDQQDRDKPPQR